LLPLHQGRITFDGVDLDRLAPHKRAELGLGYVPQTRDIFPSLTVEENLLAGLKRRPRQSLDEAYALFPRLAERRTNGGAQLSGGEQQMLSVASRGCSCLTSPSRGWHPSSARNCCGCSGA
jgi:branched-chain amino acid transport system ATP-binding protein